MSTTPNLGLSKPANNQRNWDVDLNANFDILDALPILTSLAVRTFETPSASLNVAVSAGSFRKSDGNRVDVAAVATTALAASSTTSIYYDETGALQKSTSGFPTGVFYVPLAEVTTNATTVTGIVDARVPYGSLGDTIVQATNRFLAGPASGSAAAPTFRLIVGADLPSFVASGASHASGAVPDPGATAGSTRFLREDATWVNTVSSVAMSLPSIFTVTGSPVTSTGTLTGVLATQSANRFLAGPVSGSAAAPTFRDISALDLPPQPQFSITYGASVTIDFNNGPNQRINLSGNVAFTTPANAAIGSQLKLTVKQASGGNTATWWSGVRWPGGTAPTLTSSSGAEDVFLFEQVSTGNWQAFILGLDL